MSSNEMIWSAEEFTQAIAQALAIQPDVEVIGISDLTVDLRIRGRDIIADLANFYRLYRSAPAQFPAVRQALFEALIEELPDRTEDDPAVLLTRVMPMLKPLGLLSELRQQQLPLFAYRPLTDEVMVAYVIDEGQRVVFVNEDHLARWSVTEATLYAQALQNLRVKPWRPHPGVLGTGKSALMIFNGSDGYDATRLLLPELFNDFAARIPGNLVIGIPNRDFLIAFSDAEPRVFDQVRAQIEVDARTQANPLSDQLLTIQHGQIRPYASLFDGGRSKRQ
jgi:uncharacterized protein YtpQ (UPF0354 family)